MLNPGATWLLRWLILFESLDDFLSYWPVELTEGGNLSYFIFVLLMLRLAPGLNEVIKKCSFFFMSS